MGAPTKRNHYNPCFWTAHWNPQYFRAVQNCLSKASARIQKVHVLNFKSNKSYVQPVENVHFDESVGTAEVTREMADEFYQRHHPQKHDFFTDAPNPGIFRLPLTLIAYLKGLRVCRPIWSFAM